MIKTFRHKGLKQLFETGKSKLVPSEMAKRLVVRLDVLNRAVELRDLAMFGIHELGGDRKGTWAIKVTGNYRVTFTFANRDAFDVDLEDYH